MCHPEAWYVLTVRVCLCVDECLLAGKFSRCFSMMKLEFLSVIRKSEILVLLCCLCDTCSQESDVFHQGDAAESNSSEHGGGVSESSSAGSRTPQVGTTLSPPLALSSL